MDPYAEIMSIPGITVALGHPPTPAQPWQQPQMINTKDRQVITATSANPGDSSPTNPPGKSPPPIIANNLNLLSNAQSLNQLLGVISKPIQSPPPPPPTTQPRTSTAPPTITATPQIQRQTPPPVVTNPARPALLGDCPRPPTTTTTQPPPTLHHHQ